MSTSFIHIGDFHAAPGPRNADRYRALEQIVTAAIASVPDDIAAWLWPGDLNDARMTIEDRNALAGYLQRMAQHAPVVLCYGNHDAPGDLDVFAKLKARYPIHVVDRPRVLSVMLPSGQTAAIFVLPYPQKAGLVAAGVATGDLVETAADLLEPIFMTAAAELEAARAAGDLTLMIGHVNVAGAQLSNGQPNVGHEIELHPKHLDRLGPIYKGLNHIHKPQTIAGAHYAGSVCRLDYGEIEEKRYLAIEYQDDRDLLHSVVSHPIDVAPMYHLEGELTRHGFLCNTDAGIDPWTQDWTGADVRVRYSYKASERAVIDERVIREMFKDALRLKIEGVAVPDRELRAPEVAAAKTLPEKLAAYRKEPQLPPSIAAKLALLQQRNQAELLVDVATALAAIEQPEKAMVAA